MGLVDWSGTYTLILAISLLGRHVPLRAWRVLPHKYGDFADYQPLLQMRRCSAGLALRGFQGSFGVGDPLRSIGDLPVTGLGWLTTGGVLVQISGGCVWCGFPGMGIQGLLFET